MKFNPQTRSLYTDTGELIKTLYCPLRVTQDKLNPQPTSPHSFCARCERVVLDTAYMTDEEVLATVRADPSTCLIVRAGQENITALQEPTPDRTPRSFLYSLRTLRLRR